MKNIINRLRRMFTRTTRVEYHTTCPQCEEPVRYYAEGIKTEQVHQFFADSRAASKKHCAQENE